MADYADSWSTQEKKQVLRQLTTTEQAELDARRAAAALPAIPQSVSRKAARLALLNSGKLQLVQPAIDSMDEPDRTYAQIEWDDSMTFQRGSSTLLMIAGAIGLSDDDLDALFIAAAALE